jgi:hypothetical protein
MINKRGQKPGLNRSRSFHQSFEMLLKLRPTDRRMPRARPYR